jgi:hypothetical protein
VCSKCERIFSCSTTCLPKIYSSACVFRLDLRGAVNRQHSTVDGRVVTAMNSWFRFISEVFIIVILVETFGMSSRAKETNKKTNTEKKSSGKEKKDKYVLLRDQATDEFRVVPFHEIISSKDRVKLTAGDVVTHGLRDKRIRAMIALLGELSSSHGMG